MSVINKSKTVMINPILSAKDEELLIKTKYIPQEIIEHEKSYLQYEKLKHNLKKRLREKIMDEFASKMAENESNKNIYTFTSLNLNCDSKGIYHRLKKINQNQNIKTPDKLKLSFINWFHKSPNALLRHKKNNNLKNDRDRTIQIKYYRYQNTRYNNIAKKTTDMTTKKNKPNIQIKIPLLNKKLYIKQKYKYNYSSNNANIFYNKSEFGKYDTNKGNVYIAKKNGDSYYYQNQYNNFGSLTIIQHNVENSKKYKNGNYRANSLVYNLKMNLPKTSRNRQNFSTNFDSTLKNSKSSWTIFYNTRSERKFGENSQSKDYVN